MRKQQQHERAFIKFELISLSWSLFWVLFWCSRYHVHRKIFSIATFCLSFNILSTSSMVWLRTDVWREGFPDGKYRFQHEVRTWFVTFLIDGAIILLLMFMVFKVLFISLDFNLKDVLFETFMWACWCCGFGRRDSGKQIRIIKTVWYQIYNSYLLRSHSFRLLCVYNLLN